MNENKIYTQKEIRYNIESLSNNMDLLKRQRTDITKNINSIKKQIIIWQDIDKSQLKMF